ncbi:hypothetical protein R5R35_001755 [Gryllus longicercus]|uniref:RRM domain-containing protein n=1 Tax=Gryllus longicercus TaxID=2509291 RepID=A0AAN9VV81_9ORTH
MASSGKKGKSKKGVTLAWNDFVADTEQKSATYAAPNSRSGVPRKSANWADETEDDDPRKEKVVLPSGPRATWGLDLDENKIPKSPPFLAYISNLPYEVEEDEIEDFFKDLQIVNVRLPRDERPGRLRGFGYVEFETRQSLIDALSLPDTTIKGRRIRIEVAAENDRRRGRDSMRTDRPANYDAERSAGDWRAGPREGPLGEPDRGRGSGSGFITRDRDPGFMTRDRDPGFMTRDRDPGFMTRERDGGFDRSAPRRDFGSGGFREGFDRDRGSGGGGGGFREGGREGFGDRDREKGGSWFSDRDDREKGGSWFSDRDDRERGRGFGDREGFGDRDRGRFGDRDRDFGRDRDGGFGPPRRDFGRDGFRSEGRDDLPPVDRGEPRARPRLNLQPRTKPVEEVSAPAAAADVAAPAAAAPPPTGAPASIFGGAKPVDTAAREREIEERLARERGSDAPRSERSNDRSRDRDGSRGPPKQSGESGRENFWSRSRQNGPPDNGRASPHSDHSDHEVRRDRDDSQRRYRSRPESPEGGSRSGDSHYERSTSQHSNYEHDNLGPREERGRTGRPRSGPSDVRGSSSSSSVGVPEQSSRTDMERPKSRDSQTLESVSHEVKDETRMPKYCEQEAPNFAGSNKYAYLHSDEEDHD